MQKADDDEYMYTLGVLHAAEWLCVWHDQPTVAADMVSSLFEGLPLAPLKRLAKAEGVRVPWTDVSAARRRRRAV